MRTNNRQTASYTHAVTFDTVCTEERLRVVGPAVNFCLLANDSQICFRDSKPPFLIVLGDPFEQLLSGAERKRNEVSVEKIVSDCQWRNNYQRGGDQRRGKAQPLTAP